MKKDIISSFILAYNHYIILFFFLLLLYLVHVSSVFIFIIG